MTKRRCCRETYNSWPAAVWLIHTLILLVILGSIILKPGMSAYAGYQFELFIQPQNCPELLAQVSNHETLVTLANPIFTSQNEIDHAIAFYSRVHDCLQSLPDDEMTELLQAVDFLSQYFLIFADGSDIPNHPSSLELVDFRSSDNPAIIKLRDEIGLLPPIGFIYVRYYPSRQEMPDLIEKAFENPQVAGVTILSRYIAILDEPKLSWPERFLQGKTMPGTHAHELVHAFINASLLDSTGPNHIDLPKWFEEGLANYISGSGKPHTVITPDYSMTQTASDEYQRYELYFHYLESRLGREGLNREIRNAILAEDSSQVYSSLGISNIQQLDALAVKWREKQLFARSAAGGALLLLFLGYLYSRLPEFECACGFTGKRRAFDHDRCPNCGRHLHGARRVINRLPSIVSPHCQACGKNFSPWQRSQISTYQHWVRIWLPARPGTDVPQSRFVRRICLSCQTRSQELYQTYHQHILDRLSQEKAEIRPRLAAWLDLAPTRPVSLMFDAQQYRFDDLLELLLVAWLDRQYGAWLETRPEYSFISDDLSTSYQDVLITADGKRAGSIFKIDANSFVLEWRQQPFV